MRNFLPVAFIALLLSALPAHAYKRQQGDWYVGFFMTNTCSAGRFYEDDYLMITFDGGSGVTTVRVQSKEFTPYPSFDKGIGTVSFSPSLVRYRGTSRLSHDDEGETAISVIAIDNPNILNDIGKQQYLRISDLDARISKQLSLNGSAPAIEAMKACVVEAMAGR